MYRVEFTSRAAKDLRRIVTAGAERMLTKLGEMAALSDPRQHPQVSRLRGRDGWRLRVGDYRALFTVADDVLAVTVLRVGHRREVYER